MFARAIVRLRALFGRGRMDAEIDEELRYHLEREIERNVASGMSPVDASAAARRAFGNVTHAQESMRESWGLQGIERLGQDVRYALRGIRRSPGFAATVVGTIAIGLGLNTTVFTIFNAYVLRPLAVRDPYALYQVVPTDAKDGRLVSWATYQELVNANPVFSETFADRFLFARIAGSPMYGRLVTGNYFSMLGIGAAVGRTILPADAATPGDGAVIVLNHDTWQSRFGADSSIIGKAITVKGQRVVVVGVARHGFGGLQDTPMDFWIPLTMASRLEEAGDLFGPKQPERIMIVGRLRPTMSAEQARAWLTAWFRARTADRPASERIVGTRLIARATPVTASPEIAVTLIPILIAFGLVMLIACANVANMMLARALARQREMGIRLCLGASRGRLIRQLLTESVLLSVPAAALGYAISRGTLDAGLRFIMATVPRDFAPYIRVIPLDSDVRVFVFMCLGAVGAALLFGLVPALKATRPNVLQATRGDFDTELRPTRLRNALVVAQVTICALLLIVTGVLLSGARRMGHADVGFRTSGVLSIATPEKFRRSVLEQLRTDPRIVTVAAASRVPLDGVFPSIPMVGGGRAGDAAYNFVSPSFFTALGLPIVRGRNFSDTEARDGSATVIVSERAAQRFWPATNPIGQTLRIALDSATAGGARLRGVRVARVIGVTRDAIVGFIGFGVEPAIVYYPAIPESPGTALLVRVAGDAELIRPALMARLAATDSSAVDEMHSLGTALATQIFPFTVAYSIAIAVGVIALLLTVSGIYGVLSYLVAQRAKEIGLRMALGASQASVVGLVLEQSLRLTAIGIGLGVLLAVLAASLLSSQIVMLHKYDPAGYAGALALVLLATVAASYVPSRRAARVDPMTALRRD